MAKKQILLALPIIILVAVIGYAAREIYLSKTFVGQRDNSITTTTVQFVNSTILASGTVTAQNQARLNFQTGGKLVYLPFKEGDKVTAGRTIAQLDTYALQRQLTTSLNNYRSTRDTFDQTQQNSQNNVLNSQLNPTYSKITGDMTNEVNDAIKRLADQSQASLDNSVINVELANYALQLSRLNSPLNGIITHEDVTVSGVNITPTTTFTIADPDTIIFRANIPAENIYYVSIGNDVSLAIDGIDKKIQGKVAKIYPSKVSLTNGQSVYQIDIASEQLKQLAKFDQSGSAIINTNSQNVALIPAWTVIGGKYVWVEENGKPVLKELQVGETHDNQIEVTSGLLPDDKLIINPALITSSKYKML